MLLVIPLRQLFLAAYLVETKKVVHLANLEFGPHDAHPVARDGDGVNLQINARPSIC